MRWIGGCAGNLQRIWTVARLSIVCQTIAFADDGLEYAPRLLAYCLPTALHSSGYLHTCNSSDALQLPAHPPIQLIWTEQLQKFQACLELATGRKISSSELQATRTSVHSTHLNCSVQMRWVAGYPHIRRFNSSEQFSSDELNRRMCGQL